jgi:hypothetical protein
MTTAERIEIGGKSTALMVMVRRLRQMDATRRFLEHRDGEKAGLYDRVLEGTLLDAIARARFTQNLRNWESIVGVFGHEKDVPPKIAKIFKRTKVAKTRGSRIKFDLDRIHSKEVVERVEEEKSETKTR